ncbi:unnamed protein product, partial [Rotaria sp. Silwood2]
MATSVSCSLDENSPSSPIISFIQSQKGKPLLVLDKYIFKLNKTTKTVKYWICTLIKCSAKVHTNLYDELIKIIGEHCHRPEKETIDVREFRARAKQAKTTAIQRRIDNLDKRY